MSEGLDIEAIRERLRAAQSVTTAPKGWHILYAADVADLLARVAALEEALVQADKATEMWTQAEAKSHAEMEDWKAKARALEATLAADPARGVTLILTKEELATIKSAVDKVRGAYMWRNDPEEEYADLTALRVKLQELGEKNA